MAAKKKATPSRSRPVKASPAKAAATAKAAKVVKAVNCVPPGEEDVFLATLEAHGQVTRDPGPLAPGATHRLKSDGQGSVQLKRGRFSAL